MPGKSTKKLFSSKNVHKCMHNMELSNKDWVLHYISSHRCNKCIKCLFQNAAKKDLAKLDSLNEFFHINSNNIDIMDKEISKNSERLLKLQTLQRDLINRKSKCLEVQALSPISEEIVSTDEEISPGQIKIENLFF